MKDIFRKFLEKKREKEAKTQKIKRKTKNDDKEYKPTKKEVDEIQEEEKLPQSRINRPNNKKNTPFEPISKSKKDNNNNNPRVIRLRGKRNDEDYITTQKELDEPQEEEKPLEKKGGQRKSYQRPKEPPFTELYEGSLKWPEEKTGEELYKAVGIRDTAVRVYDGEKDVIIESYWNVNEKHKNDPLNGHNFVILIDTKDFDFNYYDPAKGSKVNLNLTVDQLYNNIKKDQGSYDHYKNNFITTSEKVLTLANKNNNGISIINDMKLGQKEVYDNAAKYYKEHYYRWKKVQNYLDQKTIEKIEKRMKK